MFENKFESLNRRSKNILSVFTKTVSDLEVLNADIDIETNARLDKSLEYKAMAAAEESKADVLKENREYNSKVISKITSFLED